MIVKKSRDIVFLYCAHRILLLRQSLRCPVTQSPHFPPSNSPRFPHQLFLSVLKTLVSFLEFALENSTS